MDDVERKRVKRRICKILGVDECTSGVEVLRHVAETLGCTVSSTVFRQVCVYERPTQQRASAIY